MPTLSFKADDQFKKKLEKLAEKKGINVSAYIKLILTKEMNNELTALTDNGLTVAEELDILADIQNEKIHGPFESVEDLLKDLKKK